jgi:hypothetical protein
VRGEQGGLEDGRGSFVESGELGLMVIGEAGESIMMRYECDGQDEGRLTKALRGMKWQTGARNSSGWRTATMIVMLAQAGRHK